MSHRIDLIDNSAAPESPVRLGWPRRALRWLLRGAVLAGAGALLLWLSVLLVDFPQELVDRLEVSPEWVSSDGEHLHARLTPSGQWVLKRDLDQMSPWLAKATIAIEDRRFREHPGVDPLAVGRAVLDNVGSLRRVSGASTLTMQLCRIMDDRPRTWAAKLSEAHRALRLERRFNKDQLLALYLNQAPYGGNCRGVEAACWRYFGRSSRHLTIAEAALIAGLPQSPERLRPDLNPTRALKRRAMVLAAMEANGNITHAQRVVADAEPLPERLPIVPSPALHLSMRMGTMRPQGGRLFLDAILQRDVVTILQRALQREPEALQAAAVVVDLRSDGVVAWAGSVQGHAAPWVDHARRWRSPGSTLKTFVYASAFEGQRLAPDSRLPDIPADVFTWAPRNNDSRFRGEVLVSAALRDSLNLPAIHVARQHGLSRCIATAGSCGVQFRRGSVPRAGLSWVVGGAESTLEHLVQGYATIGRGGVARPLRYFVDDPAGPSRPVLGAGTCRAIDYCLGIDDLHVPAGWEQLGASSRPWFMWKTGTSSGGRDAWSVGHNGRFAVGVWVGRSNGSAHPGLSSRTHAEPLIAQIFSLPRVRVDKPSLVPPVEWWPLVNPLSPPDFAKARLAIVSPSNGSTLLAPEGSVAVYPRTNNEGRLIWYLDGNPLAPDALAPLRLGVGIHELRCVTPEGDAAAVKLTILPAQSQ